MDLFFQIDQFAGAFIRTEPSKAKNLILMAYQNPEFGKLSISLLVRSLVSKKILTVNPNPLV
jgi:hypothetical protein